MYHLNNNICTLTKSILFNLNPKVMKAKKLVFPIVLLVAFLLNLFLNENKKSYLSYSMDNNEALASGESGSQWVIDSCYTYYYLAWKSIYDCQGQTDPELINECKLIGFARGHEDYKLKCKRLK